EPAWQLCLSRPCLRPRSGPARAAAACGCEPDAYGGAPHEVGPRRRTAHREAEGRSEEHTSELQSLTNLLFPLLLQKKKHSPPPPSSLFSLSRSRPPRVPLSFPTRRSSDLEPAWQLCLSRPCLRPRSGPARAAAACGCEPDAYGGAPHEVGPRRRTAHREAEG